MKRFKFLFLTSVLFSLGLITPSQASIKDEFTQKNQKSEYQKECEKYYSQGQYSNPMKRGGSPGEVFFFTKPKDVYEVYMVQTNGYGSCAFAKVGIYQKDFTYSVCDKGYERMEGYACRFYKKEGYSGKKLISKTTYSTYFDLEGDNLIRYQKRDGYNTTKWTIPKIVDRSILLPNIKTMKEKGK